MTGILTGASTHNQTDRGAVYRSLVHSIFSDTRVLLLGIISSVVAATLTGVASGQDIYYVIGGLMGVFGVLRLIVSQQFQRVSQKVELSVEQCNLWEKRFTIVAVAYVFIFGVWCAVTYLEDSAFPRIVATAVTLANLIGICSRSYPITKLVDLQIFAVSVPMIGGMVYGGGYYIALAAMMVPYMMGVRQIAQDQRKSLLKHIFQRRRAEKLATQFDTALGNVPQGICMFDANGKLEVENDHMAKIMGQPSEEIALETFDELIEVIVKHSVNREEDAAIVREWHESTEQPTFNHVFNLENGSLRSVKMMANRMANGGTIVTFEDISREVQAASQIEHMRRFDRLTGLINRSQLTTLLAEKLSEGRDGDKSCAVILVNVDRFKQINDMLGHRVGDIMLCDITARLKAIIKDVGICARYGGDEFAVVVNETNVVDVAQSLADLIRDAITKPFKVDGRSLDLACSIGIATQLAPDEEVETLLRHADMALAWAKRDGRGDWRLFNDEMSKDLRERQSLETDLRRALEKDELETFFQPIVDVKEPRVAICEALVRWKHPKLGYVSPGRFIPIAEELNLIGDIGLYVLRQSCAACATWPVDTRVAVNLSAVQFKNGDIVAQVRDALMEHDLAPERLELEITESLMLDDMSETISKLHEFKGMGVSISLDDFGTGYSSLSYMNKLPLDKVKIDRSFVTGLTPNSKSLTLIQAIAGLGHQLGLTVVVEGVETDAELKVLLDNVHVEMIQGYLFSKPVDQIALTPLLIPGSTKNKNILSKIKSAGSLTAVA